MSVTYLFQTVAKNTKALIVALIKIVIHSCIQKKKNPKQSSKLHPVKKKAKETFRLVWFSSVKSELEASDHSHKREQLFTQSNYNVMNTAKKYQHAQEGLRWHLWGFINMQKGWWEHKMLKSLIHEPQWQAWGFPKLNKSRSSRGNKKAVVRSTEMNWNLTETDWRTESKEKRKYFRSRNREEENHSWRSECGKGKTR